MGLRFFSDKNRPVHMGQYPLERLKRVARMPDLRAVPALTPLSFVRPEDPVSIVNAMGEYQAMLDAIRGGMVNKAVADVPEDLRERANHLKGFGYFCDASMIGACEIRPEMLIEPYRNPDIDRLAEDLKTRQTKTLAAGIDMIMASLKESMEAPPSGIEGHTHALVLMYEHFREPRSDEPGAEWLRDAQDHRACLRATETAAVLANYIRLLGYDARAHTATTSEIDLNRATVAAGLATLEEGALIANGRSALVQEQGAGLVAWQGLCQERDEPRSIRQAALCGWGASV